MAANTNGVQRTRHARRSAMNPKQRFSVYVSAPDTSESKYFGDASTLLKAKRILNMYVRSPGYAGYIVGPGGAVVHEVKKRPPFTPLSRRNPGDGRKIGGTDAYLAQHPDRDRSHPYILVVKSGAGVSVFGLSAREAFAEQKRGVPFLSDREFQAIAPPEWKRTGENPVQLGYRSKSGKLRGVSIGRIKDNPGGRIIYHSVKCIYAQKGPGHKCDAECRRAGHLYKHEFGAGVRCIGLANGDVLLTKRG